MTYTKGKWELELRPADNCHRIRTKNEVIADVYGTIREDEGNAYLILAAVNACISINKENPMAVADEMREVVATLRTINHFIKRAPYLSERQWDDLRQITHQALFRITGGK